MPNWKNQQINGWMQPPFMARQGKASGVGSGLPTSGTKARLEFPLGPVCLSCLDGITLKKKKKKCLLGTRESQQDGSPGTQAERCHSRSTGKYTTRVIKQQSGTISVKNVWRYWLKNSEEKKKMSCMRQQHVEARCNGKLSASQTAFTFSQRRTVQNNPRIKGLKEEGGIL